MAISRVCSIEGCGKKHVARGYCVSHYSAWKRRQQNFVRKYPWRNDSFPGTRFQWLEAHVAHDSNECLIWPFSRCQAGYGHVYFRGRHTRANRAMCHLAHGEPPTPEHEAAHSCGKGHEGCVNPRHLRWATPVENGADKIAHGTWYHGEDVHFARLTEAQVKEIRRLAGALSHGEIAKRFDVSRPAISMIVSRKNWGWLE